jgi:hypothetical protein
MSEQNSQSGEQDALRAISLGPPTLYWGTRGRWGDLLTELMFSRFGVSVVHTSCFVTQELLSYQREFNQVTRQYVERTFGGGAFDAVLKEVDDFRAENYRRHL